MTLSHRLIAVAFLGFIATTTLAISPAVAHDPIFSTDSDWYYWEGFCYNHDEFLDTTPTLDARPDNNYPGWYARPVPDLDCWLTQAHPEIGNAIVWHDGPSSAVAYPSWTTAQKQALAGAVSTYWTWFEYGYPAGYPDAWPISTAGSSGIIPVNLASNPGSFVRPFDTVISGADAWNYYLDSVGLTLAAQLGHWFTWDLRYDYWIYNADLRYLLDGAEMFAANYWVNGPITYRVQQQADAVSPGHGDVTLAPPLRELNFLRTQGLIRSSQTDTLFAALDWGRDHLFHANGDGGLDNENAVWQYPGQPPILYMINGTVSTQPVDSGNGLQHYTMGCHGTSGFYKAVLRTVNIPVKKTDDTPHAGMSFPIYPWDVSGHIVHADAIYNQIFRDSTLHGETPTTPPTSTANLIVDDSVYQTLFSPSLSADQRAANVDYSSQIYAATWQPVPTKTMMRYYCYDYDHGLTPDAGHVFNNVYVEFGLTATGIDLPTLEANQEWEWLEWRRQTFPGGCSAYGEQ
jgi:hypothetical protein